jgi:hypothetical protein
VEPIGHLGLVGEVQHLQLVEQLVDVAHPVPAGVLVRPLLAVLLGQDFNLYTGIFKHCYSVSTPFFPILFSIPGLSTTDLQQPAGAFYSGSNWNGSPDRRISCGPE